MKTPKLAQKLFLFREYLFPADCAICGGTLLDEAEAWLGLCKECAGRFPVEREGRCVICGRPLISELDTCTRCRNSEKNACDGMTLIYPYAGLTRTLLQAYKFGKHRALSRFFAEKLLFAAEEIAGAPAGIPWIPVPPRPGKIKSEGWDQVERLAGILEKYHEIPVLRCLKRLASKTQKELGKSDRLTNLRGRIICTQKPPEEVILFDDVFTTGSTLNVCAETLKSAGAKKVRGICLFFD
ncbi:MAG: double zinc ribbon domain-containing protein [Spirochaetaceae bacterium]|jgi:ComF family protein|nr:double zinc ribbon domain-containing protein [Spirochaetaceae bacterium]